MLLAKSFPGRAVKMPASCMETSQHSECGGAVKDATRLPWTRLVLAAVLVCFIAAVSGCLNQPLSSGGGINITLYGFSVMKEVMEKSVFPGFVAKRKTEHG